MTIANLLTGMFIGMVMSVPFGPIGAMCIQRIRLALLPSATLQLDVVVQDAAALFLTGRPLSWTSLDTTVAGVSASGLVTAASYGGPDTNTVMIIAAFGAVADTVTLIVPPHAVAWVTATPEALSVQPLDTATIAAELEALDLTVLTGRSVAWASLDTTVARVDSTGRVTASAYTGPAVRTTRIVVTSGAATDTVPVEVLPLVVDHVIAEPLGGAHRDPHQTAARVKMFLNKTLRELVSLPPMQLLDERYEKFRRMGVFLEEPTTA